MKKKIFAIIACLSIVIVFLIGYVIGTQQSTTPIKIELHGDYRSNENRILGLNANGKDASIYYLFLSANDGECNTGEYIKLNDNVIKFMTGEYKGRVGILEGEDLCVYEDGEQMICYTKLNTSVTVPSNCLVN